MKKWMIPVLTLVLAFSLGNVISSKAMTTQEKLQKEDELQAANEASADRPMKLMDDDDNTIPSSGSLLCENGSTLDFTFVNGVLTISGNGDKLLDENKGIFNVNNSITKVVFADDCKLTNMENMFEYCNNLATVENIPETVTDMSHAFSSTALTCIPELPQNLEKIGYAFSWCTGITEVDFSALPKGITDFDGAFKGTSITEANLTVADNSFEGTLEYAYCFSNCKNLKTIVFDASNLNDNAGLWLQGIAAECPSLESFELKNIPATNIEPGSVCSAYMFEKCTSLKTVKNEGYFYFSGECIFNGCTQLTTLETKGFSDFYPKKSLEYAFYNCSSLSGNYYISFSRTSEIYNNVSDLTLLGDYLLYSFAGCNANTNFYLGCQELVDYWNQLKLTEDSKSDANFYYWKDGDHYTPSEPQNPQTPSNPTVPVTTTTTVTTNTPVDVTKTLTPVSSTKKSISVLKLKKYKKGTKKITGKTLKKAKVVVVVNKKKYTTVADAKGNFKITLKKKLKKKEAIKVTVSKSGYKAKTKTFKVK